MNADKVQELVERIASESRGTLTEDAVWAEIASGRWVLVAPNDETLVVLDEYTTPTGLKILEFVGIAADSMKDWTRAAIALEAEARVRGVNRMRGTGRVGWAKEAKKYGFKMTRVVVEKDLYDA